MSRGIEGKIVLITGGSGGSGAVTAQLLAAELNKQGGAGWCPAAETARAAAQALLVKANFTGTGSYFGSKSASADRALATSLASTLDKYNNNAGVC